MDKIEKLEEELKQLKRERYENQVKQANELKEKFQKKSKIYIWWSDDYYWASVWDLSFYYWYEETMCKKHPKNEDCEDEFDCEKRERCFTAVEWDKEVMRIPTSDLSPECNNMEDYIICGILMYIDNKNKWTIK